MPQNFNATNLLLNTNKKTNNDLTTIKEYEFNQDYEKKLFEFYTTLKQHFENGFTVYVQDNADFWKEQNLYINPKQ